jgi:hypothetical protein
VPAHKFSPRSNFNRISGALNFHPTNDVMKFRVMGIVPPASMPINIAKAAGLFADDEHAKAYGRELVLHRYHNGFGCGFHWCWVYM